MNLRIFILTLFIGINKFITAGNFVDTCGVTAIAVVIPDDSCSLVQTLITGIEKDSLSIAKPYNKKGKRKKLIVAILAFPFPFGFVGAHRVVLGTKPWVPVVYVATFGGCFGVLPLIDFFVIIFTKDLKKFENDPNVFMWAK
jgi:TM2 domain-containing membrane protein YozV